MIVLLVGPHEGADEAAKHGSFFETLFHAAGVWAPLTLGVLAIGLAANFFWLYRDFNRRVNGAALGSQLKKLIASGNAERAVKLCRAAPEAVAAQIALVGLDARSRNENALAAMQDASARTVASLRPGLLVTQALGAAAFIEGSVMVAAAASKGFPSDEIGAIVILPALLACLVAANAMRWSGMQRDIGAIIDAVR